MTENGTREADKRIKKSVEREKKTGITIPLCLGGVVKREINKHLVSCEKMRGTFWFACSGWKHHINLFEVNCWEPQGQTVAVWKNVTRKKKCLK